MRYLLLKQEDHDYLTKELGFEKVGSRCPVCYTESLIAKRVRDAIKKSMNREYPPIAEEYDMGLDLLKELGIGDEQ